MNYPIIYEDNEWLAVDKATGIATHAAKLGGIGIVEWLALHQNRELHVCSRLDKGTSGILLFAKHAKASKQAQGIHEQQTSQKSYRFISTKRYKDSRGGKRQKDSWQVTEPLGGKECLTRFRLLEKGHGYFCYEAVIGRGRTHQIRQHAAMSGVPILGDAEYGEKNFSRLCLHCCEVHWPGIRQDIISSQPDSFSLLLAGKNGLVVEGAIAWERRLDWPGLVTNSFRLIQRGELSLSVSIDLYESFLSIASFSEDLPSGVLKKKIAPLLDYLSTKITWKGVILRCHIKNPHQKKLIHDVLSWGEPVPEQILALEHDLAFGVNLNDSQHVGLFLDQRDSRRRVQRVAQSRRVANLFSFTCSFSAAALDGGAEVVVSVDLAASTLARGKDNFAYNAMDIEHRGKFIEEDVCKWLNRQERRLLADPESFPYWDLIICDPPVFASAGRGRSFHVQKQWPELARQIRLLLSEKGVALFANNHRAGNASFYLAELKKHFQKVTQLSAPLDFPSLQGQPDHVRIYWCEV